MDLEGVPVGSVDAPPSAWAPPRQRLSQITFLHRDDIVSTWLAIVGDEDKRRYPELERYCRSLLMGLADVFAHNDWSLTQTIIDGLAERRARSGLQLENGFQRTLLSARYAFRQHVGDDVEAEELLLETLHECVFRFFESYQGIRLASENDRLYTRIINSLVTALEARDPYTKGHSLCVALLSQKIAMRIGGIDPARAYLAGLLHDVGKVGVPDYILSKTGSLSEEEWVRMRMHPALGAQILRPIKLYPEVVEAVEAHHENMDGSGYPNALAGDAIPDIARIIRVADSFDAMTSSRVYRASHSIEEALTEMRCLEDRIYDAAAVTALGTIVETPASVRELSLASLQIDLG